MNGFAWWCFEKNVNLEEAEALARKAVALCEPAETRANIMDTVAEAHYAAGNYRSAVEWETRALELDPENEFFQRQLEKYQEALTQD